MFPFSISALSGCNPQDPAFASKEAFAAPGEGESSGSRSSTISQLRKLTSPSDYSHHPAPSLPDSSQTIRNSSDAPCTCTHVRPLAHEARNILISPPSSSDRSPPPAHRATHVYERKHIPSFSWTDTPRVPRSSLRPSFRSPQQQQPLRASVNTRNSRRPACAFVPPRTVDACYDLGRDAECAARQDSGDYSGAGEVGERRSVGVEGESDAWWSGRGEEAVGGEERVGAGVGG